MQEIYDTHGRTIAQESQTTKEFVASFQEHSASQQEEDLTLDAAADPEPVPIDTLPQT